MANNMKNIHTVGSASAILLLLAITTVGCFFTEDESYNNFMLEELQRIGSIPLDVLLVGVGDTVKVAQGTSQSIQEVMFRLQKDPRVQEALEKIRASGPVQQLTNNLGGTFDKLGKDLHNTIVKPVADQAKPLVDSVEKKRQEIWRDHENRFGYFYRERSQPKQ